MFGLFKKNESFNNLSEFKMFCQNEMEKDALTSYKKSPLRGGPMEAMALLEGLNSSHARIKSRSAEFIAKHGWSQDQIDIAIRDAFRVVHDKFIE